MLLGLLLRLLSPRPARPVAGSCDACVAAVTADLLLIRVVPLQGPLGLRAFSPPREDLT